MQNVRGICLVYSSCSMYVHILWGMYMWFLCVICGVCYVCLVCIIRMVWCMCVCGGSGGCVCVWQWPGDIRTLPALSKCQTLREVSFVGLGTINSLGRKEQDLRNGQSFLEHHICGSHL